jgi:hypothetical protein
MSDSAPLRADEVVVGCVTENNPKYLGQTLRLLQSIRWFGGELAQSRVVVGAVEQIDPRARRAFEALAAEVRIVPQFDARNPPGNRLQVFEELYPSAEENFLVLDCDTIVVRDPLPMPFRRKSRRLRPSRMRYSSGSSRILACRCRSAPTSPATPACRRSRTSTPASA